jgi:hypothetical protein
MCFQNYWPHLKWGPRVCISWKTQALCPWPAKPATSGSASSGLWVISPSFPVSTWHCPATTRRWSSMASGGTTQGPISVRYGTGAAKLGVTPSGWTSAVSHQSLDFLLSLFSLSFFLLVFHFVIDLCQVWIWGLAKAKYWPSHSLCSGVAHRCKQGWARQVAKEWKSGGTEWQKRWSCV